MTQTTIGISSMKDDASAQSFKAAKNFCLAWSELCSIIFELFLQRKSNGTDEVDRKKPMCGFCRGMVKVTSFVGM